MQIAKFMPENICQLCNLSFRKAKLLVTHQWGKSCSNCEKEKCWLSKFEKLIQEKDNDHMEPR